MKFIKHCIILLLLFSFLSPSSASACSCAGIEPVEKAFNRAEAVFVGEVVEIKEVTTINGYQYKQILFQVETVWKGDNKTQIIVQTAMSGASCGIHFIKGSKYIVYAQSDEGSDNVLRTNICTRTSQWRADLEDLSVLGEGTSPEENVDLTDEMNKFSFSDFVGKAISKVVEAFEDNTTSKWITFIIVPSIIIVILLKRQKKNK
jgi:hypothetical protein